MTHGSHGTHVASIAAGNRGVCREAVHRRGADLAARARTRTGAAPSTTRRARARRRLPVRPRPTSSGLPVSINISLGTNGHAHDGSSADQPLDRRGADRARPQRLRGGRQRGPGARRPTDDLGWVMGRIHTSGRIAAAGLDADIEWIVVGNGGHGRLRERARALVQARRTGSPCRCARPTATGSGPWSRGSSSRTGARRRQLRQRLQRALPPGQRRQLHRDLPEPVSCATPPIVGVAAGSGSCGCTASRCATAATTAGSSATTRAALGPRRRAGGLALPVVLLRALQRRPLVGQLAGLRRARHRGGATSTSRGERIHITSSQGPTRDGRSKPEIAAPGTDIVAAQRLRRRTTLGRR